MPASPSFVCVEIRAARDDDLPGIVQIYNHYVEETPVTFDVEPFDVEARRPWFEAFSTQGRHRLLVVCDEHRVLGYASSGRFRLKPAYDRSVETTIYLAPDATGQGLGRTLYSALFEILDAEASAHRAFAGIVPPNPASLALHRDFGFTPIGTFRDVGFKFGRYWDVDWYERPLE